MNFMDNNGYIQGAPINGQFVEANAANMDYPMLHEGPHGNVAHHHNRTHSDTNIAGVPVKTEIANSVPQNIPHNAHVPLANGEGGDSAVLASKGQGFPFHDPFDIESYPITNPPIFDSTMMLPYTTDDGITRRRRISISNGQIGQIVNHEFLLDNENPLDEYAQGGRVLSRLAVASRNDLRPASVKDSEQQFNQLQQLNQLQHLAQESQIQNGEPLQPPGKYQVQQSQRNADQNTKRNTQRNTQRKAEPPLGPPSVQQVRKPAPAATEQEPPAAGVPPPNHQLIYNNEVIYNPNNGPIPGTAAWKKERLLERNRVAAFKCRQRKKHAQQQLHDNISKYQSEIDLLTDKLNKYEAVFQDYNAIISKYADSNSDLKLLAKFDNIEKMKDEDIMLISKMANS